MDGFDHKLTFTNHTRINNIDAAEWDACAGHDNPFISHAYLSALEDSGSAAAETGWLPHHIALRNHAGTLIACVPAYIKSHSYGEYVFDHAWAEAFQRAGGRYYPKLQCAVPFSPVPGARLLCRPHEGIDKVAIGEAIINLCRQMNLSSAHITFCNGQEYNELGGSGWLQRLGTQFHWHNNGYSHFDEFLASMASRHRKILKRERRDANNCGLRYLCLTGDDIKPRHWDAFYCFYQNTIDRKWGSAYLTREFFTLLSERLGDKVVLMMAENDGQLMAGALNLAGSDTLYGRNWGVEGDWPFLHFELCYYRAIDYAIEHGLKRVEAGAQGMHKIKRGYLPQPTYSLHWLDHPGLSRAVESFLEEERRAVEEEMKALMEYSPFKEPIGT